MNEPAISRRWMSIGSQSYVRELVGGVSLRYDPQ